MTRSAVVSGMSIFKTVGKAAGTAGKGVAQGASAAYGVAKDHVKIEIDVPKAAKAAGMGAVGGIKAGPLAAAAAAAAAVYASGAFDVDWV